MKYHNKLKRLYGRQYAWEQTVGNDLAKKKAYRKPGSVKK